MVATDRNRDYYTAVYDKLELEPLLSRAKDLEFFDDAVKRHTSWYGLYQQNFAGRVAGRRVLELGAGDGLNSLILARLGAEVTAIEIAPPAVALLKEASRILDLSVEAICGDFLELELPKFDFIVGKAFLHHLDPETEDRFLEKCADLLEDGGEARFQEPAINSAALDTLRWIVPAPGRPSILSRKAFSEWKAADPHPEREHSSCHYRAVGARYFEDVEILTFGALERFRRWIPDRERAGAYAKWALHIERRYLPQCLANLGARSQTILYRRPKCTAPEKDSFTV